MKTASDIADRIARTMRNSLLQAGKLEHTSAELEGERTVVLGTDLDCAGEPQQRFVITVREDRAWREKHIFSASHTCGCVMCRVKRARNLAYPVAS